MNKNSFKRGIINPLSILDYFLKRKPTWFSDKVYVKLRYLFCFRKRLDLNNPQTFNEKLNWLKLYGGKDIYHTMADKYLVKQFVNEKLGTDVYTVPCYGVWDSFDQIDFNKLPNSFVLKATHDSSGATICRDKNSFDFESAKRKFDVVLSRSWYYRNREWVYKDLKPRIIADKLLDDGSGHELQDYKFWCFNGEPKIMYITNKGKNIYENFYDMNFQPLNINHGYPRSIPEYSKPIGFNIMIDIAKKLSVGIPFVRIDFFEIAGHVYFGEYTFYDWGGEKPFQTQEMDLELGSYIHL